MLVNVKSRSGRDMGSFDVNSTTTVGDFKALFAKKHRISVHRQYFTMEEGSTTVRVTDIDRTLASYNVKDGAQLVYKDLGPQVSWTTVFLTEYFGPILIHSLVFFFPSFFYGEELVKNTAVAPATRAVQTIAFALVVFHYAKRELETLFVHRFSNATMPFFNIFKNSTHYWVLSGVLIAYPLYHPAYTPLVDVNTFYIGAALFVLAELGNLHAHITLRNLRPPGTRARGIPRGGMFELVSCANYFWELVAWLVFAIFTNVLGAYIFFVVSFGQIYIWALKKHRQYRKDFPDYPRRKALIPFVC